MRQPIFRDNAPRLAIAHRSVVDHRVESSQRICLLRDGSRLLDARQVANDNSFSTWNRCHRVLPSRLIARMQHDLMPLLHE